MPQRATTRSTPTSDEGADSPLGRLELGVSALVRWIAANHQRARIAEESGVDLTAASVSLLEHLEMAGPMRVSDIAACHQVDTSTATVRVQALRRQGLVDRAPDPDDGRVSMIAITPNGREAVRRLRVVRRGLLAELLGDAGPDELEQAAALLRRIEQRMIDATYPGAD